jgi:fused signal recognition particle receptor
MDGSVLIVVIALVTTLLSALTVTAVVLFAPPSSLPKEEPAVLSVRDSSHDVAKPQVALQPPVAPQRAWFLRLSDGLQRTRVQMVRSLDEFFLSKEARATREETLERLFEVLVSADVGVATSERLVSSVKTRLRGDEQASPEALKSALRSAVLTLLETPAVLGTAAFPQATLEAPTASCHVVMLVGVNGVGKTTTTGKLAFKVAGRGLGAVVGAADTFRAAAVEQLAVWAQRSGASLVRLKEGSDPASVAFETVRLAKAEGKQVAFVDTAGRLHNRNDLMQELAKIKRVMGKEIAEAPHEVLLVVDATTGQNALQQARVFREIAGVTGVVLTKLDGTAKGGIALAIVSELGLPIRYIGVGESVEDLEVFNAGEFVEALFA